MESVQTVNASVSVALPVVERPATPPVVQAVATDLSPAQSVTVPNSATAASANMQGAPADFQHSVTIDPATREVVFRLLDVRTHQVIRQTPDAALLRREAYQLAISNGKTAAQAFAVTNLQI
jgi:hypothetical protein